MLKFARWSTTHRLYIAIGWVILLIGVNVISQSAEGRPTPTTSRCRTPTRSAPRTCWRIASRRRPETATRSSSRSRTAVCANRVKSQMSASCLSSGRLPHVSGVISPTLPARPARPSPQRADPVRHRRFQRKGQRTAQERGEGVVKAADAARTPGLQIELGGQANEQTEQEGFGITTAVGLMAAIVVLLITFGSLIAMGLPIVTALLGLGTGLGVIALFTHVVDTPNFSSGLAAMIGLSLGIEYSLLRDPLPRGLRDARPQLRRRAESSCRRSTPPGARLSRAARCDRAAGMMLLGVDFLYGVAISASIGVLLVMLASLTLLPACSRSQASGVRPRRRARSRGVGHRPRHGKRWLRGASSAGSRWPRARRDADPAGHSSTRGAATRIQRREQ